MSDHELLQDPPADRPDIISLLKERVPGQLILGKGSEELSLVTETYADGRVQVFGAENGTGASRTEIYLPDGRVVAVHRNMALVSEFASSRFDAIKVSGEDGIIGTIELRPTPGTSSHSPDYTATLGDRELKRGPNGGRLDLSLADELLGGRPVAIEEGFVNSYDVYGSTLEVAQVIRAMTPGYTLETVEELLKPVVEHAQGQQSRQPTAPATRTGKLGAFATRLLGRRDNQ